MGVASRPGGHSFAHRAPESPPRQPRGVGCVLGGPSHTGKWEDHAAWLPVPWAPPGPGRRALGLHRRTGTRAELAHRVSCRRSRATGQASGRTPDPCRPQETQPVRRAQSFPPAQIVPRLLDAPVRMFSAATSHLLTHWLLSLTHSPSGAHSAALVPHVTCTLPGPIPGCPARFPGEGPSPNPRPQLSGCTCHLVTWLRMLSWGRRGGSGG